MEKSIKKSGITLIALVITIVVLIILATVIINLSLGDNGIFNRARTAKEQYQNAQDYEQTEIEKITNSMDSFGGDKISADMVAFTPDNPNWTGITNVKEALDYLYNN